MKTPITIFRPGQPPENRELDLARAPGGDKIREIVLPEIGADSYMERVAVLYKGEATDMFVDEDGRAKGLPINVEATKVYHAFTKSQRRPTVNGQMILGVAVLFHRRVWF